MLRTAIAGMNSDDYLTVFASSKQYQIYHVSLLFSLQIVACRSSGLARCVAASSAPVVTCLPTSLKQQQMMPPSRTFTALATSNMIAPLATISSHPKIMQLAMPMVDTHQPIRSLTKFSIRKGKRKSVKCILRRFQRLHWGGWIRTICGRNKKIWKKSMNRRRRLRQHVLVNATQAWLLDSMVGPYWRKPRHYIDDPYEPYHQRDFEFARDKPIEYWPPKEEYRKN